MYTFDLDIPFESARHADIVLNSIVQDEEPRSGSMIERFTFHFVIVRILYYLTNYFANSKV